VFDFLLYYLITTELTSVLDSKINHEIEHVSSSFYVIGDSIIITRPSEFQEKDLVEIYDNSFFLQIYKNNGRRILLSDNVISFGAIDIAFPEFDSPVYFTNTKTPKEVLRSGYKNLFNEKGEKIGYLQISARRIFLESALGNLFLYNLIILPFVLLIVIVASIVISKKLVKPIYSIISTANRISAFELRQRLPLEDDPQDEMEQLKITLNNLFERLETQVKEISSFADNASHQLMTPLATLISEIDFILKRNEISSDIKSSLIIMKEQTARIQKIVSSLLMMARAEKNRNVKNLVFSLNSLINNSIKPFYLDNTIEYQIEDEIFLRGNAEYFFIAIQNIIENAIKYSPPNSKIKFQCQKDGEKIVISISDEGIGIPDNEKTRIFERFYRGENVEKLGTKGTGLGLSLSRTIITSMGGSIGIKDNMPQGTIVIINLPLVKMDED
jgi:signal transduction histidine kinase